ncbi:M16 family metallopeptidase [Tessaracoccus sp. Y1736]
MNRPDVTLGIPWHFPTPTVSTLGSGLTMWHFELPWQHIATFEVMIPAPLAAEPADREGVGTVALHAIDEGTRTHPDGAIGELLEDQGATLHGTARQRYTTLGGQAPSRRLPQVLPLFTEVLSEPTFDDRDVAHHVEAQVAGYESTLASPSSAVRMALRRELFGTGDRGGRPAAGTPATLAAVTPADAHGWHRAHFSPQGATLVVAGNLTVTQAEAALGPWTAPPPQPTLLAAAPAREPRIVVVDQPGAVQATVVVGRRTVTRSDPRWASLRLAGHAVAGAFASRLNLELRERLGYSYGIGGGFSPGPDEGLFTVGGSVRTEVAADAVARLLEGVALPEAFGDDEIDDARRYLIGVAPLATETSADIVAQASALAAAGLDPGYMNRHFSDLAAVTPADATAAFRTLVSPRNVTVAVMGDASALLPALAAVGLVAEVVDLRR